jgi:hypothetical protein
VSETTSKHTGAVLIGTQGELGGCGEAGAASSGTGKDQDGYADGWRGVSGDVVGNTGASSGSPRPVHADTFVGYVNQGPHKVEL